MHGVSHAKTGRKRATSAKSKSEGSKPRSASPASGRSRSGKKSSTGSSKSSASKRKSGVRWPKRKMVLSLYVDRKMAEALRRVLKKEGTTPAQFFTKFAMYHLRARKAG